MVEYVNPNIRLSSLRASSLAFGENAGYVSQGSFAVALGQLAGYLNQGQNAIAIGSNAGANNQAANSIVINATGANLEASVSGLFMDPVRTLTAGNAVMHYDLATKEAYASTTLDNGVMPANISVTSLESSANTTVGGDLAVTGNAAVTGDLSVSGAITVESLTGNVDATNIVSGKLDNARLPDAITITGNITSNAFLLSADLSVSNDASISGDVSVGGNVAVTGDLTAATLSGNISADDLVSGKVDNARLPDAIVITGNVTSNAYLLSADLSVSNDASVSGDMSVGGNVAVTGDLTAATLSGNISADDLVSGKVDNARLPDAITITGNVTSNAYLLSADLSVSNDASVGANLSVTSDASVGGDLSVTGNAAVTGDLSVSGAITVESLTGNVDATNIVSGKLDNARLPDAITITGNITSNAFLLSADLSVSNDASIGGDLSVSGNVAVTGDLTAATLSGNISADDLVSGKVDNARLPDAITITGNVTSNAYLLSADLSVTSDATVGGDLSVSSNVAVTGDLTAATLSGNISADDLVSGKVDNARLPDAITITGNITSNAYLLSADLSVSNDASVGANLSVTSDATIGGDLAVTGNAAVTGDLSVSGSITVESLTGNVNADNIVSGKLDNARLPDAITITGNITSNAALVSVNLAASGDAAISGNLAITKDVTMTGHATVGGNLTVSGNLNVLSGNVVMIETETQITDQIMITNAGSGPALSVDQSGAEDIAVFKDDGEVIARFHDGGAMSVGGNVATTLATFHVAGDAYASGNVTTDAYFVGNASAMTHLNASELAFGTIENPRLPTAITITGNVTSNASLVSSSLSVSGNATVGGDASVTGNISAVGDIIAFFSDARLKENVTLISDPMERLSHLKGVFYTFNDTAKSMGFMNTEQQVGVLAQDVQVALPHAVKPAPFDHDEAKGASRSGENYLTVQYEKIVPLLIETAKIQHAEIQSLKSAVSAMRGQIETMRRRGRF